MVTRAAGLALIMLMSVGCVDRRGSHGQIADHAPAAKGFAVKGRLLHPEIARDEDDRSRGLQDREPPEHGLMLVFPRSSRQSIWMPNCPVDLEGWIIDDRGTLLEIMELPAEPAQESQESMFQYHARLPRHRAANPSRIVWEFRAGTAARLGVGPGESIDGDWLSVLATDRRRSTTQ